MDAPLAPLALDDIPEVMRIERLPGYDAVVGRYDADEHAAHLASPDARYFGIRQGVSLAGFVILQEVRGPVVLLRRIAVAEPGRGVGTRLVRGAMDWAFQETPGEAMRLDVARGNRRARRVYEREGFEACGADEVHDLMRISRGRWAELRGR